MKFSQVVENFSNCLPGTDAYVILRQEMLNLIKADPFAASAYFLISGFAKTYVMLYDDQEVKPEFAEESQHLMVSYLKVLEEALETGDKATLFEAMNAIVSNYEQSKKIF